MNVLIACEESQTVCKAFRARGLEAYSCDIQECSGGYPEWHIKGDVLPLLQRIDDGNNGFWLPSFDTMDGVKHYLDRWDLIIAHPPCTYLTVTGNKWFNIEKYGEKALKRISDREEAVEFFMKFLTADCDHIAIENPVGYMSTYYRKPDQIIQPWMFGDAAEKRTCLWLTGLPILHASRIVTPPERVKYNSGKTMPTWYAHTWSLPAEERQKLRSKTFPGIAEAMAEQWGNYIMEVEK